MYQIAPDISSKVIMVKKGTFAKKMCQNSLKARDITSKYIVNLKEKSLYNEQYSLTYRNLFFVYRDNDWHTICNE